MGLFPQHLRRSGDFDQHWRACRIKDDPEGYARDKRKQALKEREAEIELLEHEKRVNERVAKLSALPPAPPVQRVSHEAFSKEVVQRFCEQRGVKERQFTDTELKSLDVKAGTAEKELAKLRSRVWDDYLFKARENPLFREQVPHFVLFATRKMLELEISQLRNELRDKVGVDRFSELMLKVAELSTPFSATTATTNSRKNRSRSLSASFENPGRTCDSV